LILKQHPPIAFEQSQSKIHKQHIILQGTSNIVVVTEFIEIRQENTNDGNYFLACSIFVTTSVL